MKVAAPAFAYFAIVFGVGFVLGTIRTLWLAPMVGSLASVAIELPIILAASWLVARWLVVRFSISSSVAAFLIGVIAFVLLQVAEFGLSTAVGTAGEDWVRSLLTPAGLVGVAGQLCFASFPWAAFKRASDRSGDIG